jgi:predicted amidophosphoribosyltransferase
LKYHGDLRAADSIIVAAAEFVRPSVAKFDLIVPVPPSGKRRVQPVLILARGLGAALDLPVADCVRTTRSATQLKGVMEPERRNELLAGLHTVDRKVTMRKSILLLDDLYRSGATLNAITNLLMTGGKASSVRVLAITRTRSNQ